MRKIATIAVFVAAAMAMPSAVAGERTESKPYVLGGDALLTECELGTGLDSGLFGACFDLVGNETHASILIEDLTAMPVGGAYAFRTTTGSILGLGLFCSSVSDLAVPAGSAELTVYVTGPGFGSLNCLGEGSAGAGTVGTITVTFQLSDTTVPPLDEERECLQATPAELSLAGVTDDGGDVTLAVKVLLDGVDPSLGEAVFTKAAESYAPLAVDMVVASFEEVTFEGVDAHGLIAQAKAREGGQRPEGVDIVYVLTSKDIESLGQSGVAGLADCIGGIRYPDKAFAVGEVIAFENIPVGPFTFYRDATARTAAHEIGHLMGAHHHYANCVEEAPGDGLNGELTPCTLMFNSLDLLGPHFSILNGAVVRGHAVQFAGGGA